MNYLVQYIREAQVSYPTVSRTPVDVLKHLLFTNGNGCELVDGVFVKVVGFGRCVPWTQYYKEQKDYKEMIEYYDNMYSDNQIEEIYNRCAERNKARHSFGLCELKDEDTLWKDAVTGYDGRYDDVTFLYKPEDVLSQSYIEQQILSSEYIPYLGLGKGFYKLDLFTENTDRFLLEVGRVLCLSYINTLQRFLSDEVLLVNGKKSLGGVSTSLYKEVYERDVYLLKENVVNIQKLLGGKK